MNKSSTKNNLINDIESVIENLEFTINYYNGLKDPERNLKNAATRLSKIQKQLKGCITFKVLPIVNFDKWVDESKTI